MSIDNIRLRQFSVTYSGPWIPSGSQSPGVYRPANNAPNFQYSALPLTILIFALIRLGLNTSREDGSLTATFP